MTPQAKCNKGNCEKNIEWEHEGAYYCTRHYFTIVKGQKWVDKMEYFMPRLKKES